ncbi:hypothetical protein BDD21_3040 [Thiocapsa rosea]|uniref:Uncharacterized protein n=1 Tax=Thiocapsa rosea TaxID=69360 RepID=A0A495V859_9GAMM|nr:hypothetical protein BDD21_3040 [Thiocapsa rosea]
METPYKYRLRNHEKERYSHLFANPPHKQPNAQPLDDYRPHDAQSDRHEDATFACPLRVQAHTTIQSAQHQATRTEPMTSLTSSIEDC